VGEPQRDLWAPFDALEQTVGAEKAALLSYRPPPVRVSHPTEAGPAEDLDSTAHFLARRALDSPGGPPGDRAGGGDGGEGGPAIGEEIRVVETIGQGGMGVIFRAVQASFGREIALKRAASGDPALLAQFISEARITGALEHANIVPVYTLRASPGAPPELAMKLIRGASWADLLHTSAGEGLDLEAHLRIFLSVCNAVSYAHRQRIIHRDLKPENVMTDVFGQVFVVDWGFSDEALAARAFGAVLRGRPGLRGLPGSGLRGDGRALVPRDGGRGGRAEAGRDAGGAAPGRAAAGQGRGLAGVIGDV
jgi:hypothetical protein